jgi:hypothetical protein
MVPKPAKKEKRTGPSRKQNLAEKTMKRGSSASNVVEV